MKLKCQVCFELIAMVDQAMLNYPMRGKMFTSVDPFHGFPEPFPQGAGWEDFKCPYGPHRPMFEDDKILTDVGLVLLSRDGIKPNEEVKKDEPVTPGVESEEKERKAYACEICKKEFEKEINLNRHKAMAHKGVK